MCEKERLFRILIVDDNKNIRKTLILLLSREEFVFDEAGNGKEALEKIKNTKPDIILLDYIMPIMDGLETLRRLKDSPETGTIPVIFCSADLMIKFKAKELKADCYINKPFSSSELLRKIASLLGLDFG